MAQRTWQEDAAQGWELLNYEDEIQWFGTKEEGGRKRVMGGRLRSVDSLIGTVRNAAELGWNFYLNLNPTFNRPGKSKLAREDVKLWRYIVVDLDPGGDALVPPVPQPCITKPSHYLYNAHRIFSGRGYQYWLPIDTSSIDELYPEKAERIMQGFLRALAAETEAWASGWIVDTTCSDLARVVRCPGSVNQKTGARAVVEHVHKGAGIDIGVLMRYNQPTMVELVAERLHPPNSLNLLDTLPHLNIRARTFILEGASSPGRHSACYATCKNLHELGVDSDRALEWLLIGAGKCRGLWLTTHHGKPNSYYESMPLLQSEVQRIVKQVYGG
jgi:hypothetical protein